MAKILITGMCSGTEKRHSEKSGKDYTVTTFAEVPSMKSLTLFGDFGLPSSMQVQEYVFEASFQDGRLNFPTLVAVNPVNVSASKPKS